MANEYLSLMRSVAEFANMVGLNSVGLFREEYDPSLTRDSYVISVSRKRFLDYREILGGPEDRPNPFVRSRLDYPIVNGSLEEIEGHKRKAESSDAEVFCKKTIAKGGYVEPSPDFLKLDPVKQVEYALHEAFHSTPKIIFGKSTPYFPYGGDEEARAMIAGHLGAIHFFKSTDLEKDALEHWKKHFGLALEIKKFYDNLSEIYEFRVGENGRPILKAQILQEKEELLSRARLSLGDQLGGPINNAFFIYWNYYYGEIPRTNEEVSGLESIVDILKILREGN